jgi:hypothetical protein
LNRAGAKNGACVAFALSLALAGGVRAQGADSTSAEPGSAAVEPADAAGDGLDAPHPGRARHAQAARLEPLVPELADAPYRLDPGPRPFQNRIAFSPGYGYLGSERLFAFRLAYHPDQWLGYEASIGHNPGQSVHAVLHMVSAIVRHPLPGRWQPYVSGGYGMMMVFPGHALNASPVTKNALAVGGGLEFYIRSDLALRADVRHATVFGREKDRDGVVAFGYLQETVGMSFYRSVKP